MSASKAPTATEVPVTEIEIAVPAVQGLSPDKIRIKIQEYLGRYSDAIRHKTECARIEARLREFSKYLRDEAAQWRRFHQDTADEDVLKAVAAYSDTCVAEVAGGREPGP
jgi:hypothetical protein